MLVYLPEIDSPFVALTFWLLTYQQKNPKRQPFLIRTRCHAQDNPVETYAELMSSVHQQDGNTPS